MRRTSISLSSEQESAVEQIGTWLQGYKGRVMGPVFKLFGPAGSGKTTLVRSVVECHDGGLLAAFAGKAAYVSGERVGRSAQTLHSAVYFPDACGGPVGDATFCGHGQNAPHLDFTVNRLNGALADAEFLVLDECSMVDERMGRDVLSFGKPVLAIGDPFQLLPIDGGGFFTGGEPHFLLTEVHRQGADGHVIDLATAIRVGEDVSQNPLFVDSETVLEEFDPDMIICGTNASRARTNRLIRNLDGHRGELPERGEKLICLQNSPELGLLNGQMLDVIATTPARQGAYIAKLIDPLTGEQYTVPAWASDLTRAGSTVAYTPDVARLAFGYAITCHKAQGSEWDRVLVIDDWRWADPDRWLYTAVTRASKDVRITRNIPYPSWPR